MAAPADAVLKTFEGCVDHHDNVLVRGWAWFPARPADVAIVEVVVNGSVIASGAAASHRIDLIRVGKRGGSCAFEIPIDGLVPQDEVVLLHVRLAGGEEFPGSPFELNSAPPLETAEDADGPSGSGQALGDGIGVVGYLDALGPESIAGWVFDSAVPNPLQIALYEGEKMLTAFTARDWRAHAEELRQGDGRCGFDLPVPDALKDGEIHSLDLRILDTDQSILTRPLRVRLESPPLFPPPPLSMARRLARLPRRLARRVKARLIRKPAPPVAHLRPVEFSIVVNFYNMQREAARTLQSMTLGYQQGADGLNYEVLCIDNGSNPPLDEDWIRGFGPQFRLVRPSKLLPSPCFAINEAVRQAKGAYVAIVIDGAHVLTPGVFAETRAAIKDFPGTVVAMRHWFIGGDQRWLSSIGYSRAMEDLLFDKISWPQDGYQLFQIGVPLDENPNQWFNPMAESNCLFMPAKLYQRIGGLDEAFSEPGGGFSNLDLFRKAATMGPDLLTCLVGEATFHQYHGGTTTNVTDAEKDSRVRAYSTVYQNLRGEAFGNTGEDRIRLRGRIVSSGAIATRHRPLFPARLGVTDRVRPGSLERQFDAGSQSYLESLYAELGLHHSTTWLGAAVDLAPADLVSIQEILNRLRPGRIVLTSREPGLIRFLDDVLGILGLEQTRIILVTDSSDEAALPSRVTAVVGPVSAPATLAEVERLLEAEESVLVLFAPQPGEYRPLPTVRAYARFVTFGSYFVYLRSVFGQPWLGYSKYWHLRTIDNFLNQNNDFVVDKTWTQHLISSCPSGYLQRVRSLPPSTDYDPTLDNIERL
jgi:cephalosporin hydroxylase